MIALLLAAQVAAAAAPAAPPPKATMQVLPRRSDALAVNPKNPFAVPAWCGRQTLRTADPKTTRPQTLGELPPANLEYAVDRRVRGCPVRTPVMFNGQPIRSR